MKKGFEKLSFSPWVAKLFYWLGCLAIAGVAMSLWQAAAFPAPAIFLGALILLVVNRVWYEWVVAIFAIAENTRLCALHSESLDPKDLGEAIGRIQKKLENISKGQETIAEVLAGIRADRLAQQVNELNGGTAVSSLCPYCGAEVVLPGWIKDGRGVSCPSCGERFKFSAS